MTSESPALIDYHGRPAKRVSVIPAGGRFQEDGCDYVRVGLGMPRATITFIDNPPDGRTMEVAGDTYIFRDATHEGRPCWHIYRVLD